MWVYSHSLIVLGLISYILVIALIDLLASSVPCDAAPTGSRTQGCTNSGGSDSPTTNNNNNRNQQPTQQATQDNWDTVDLTGWGGGDEDNELLVGDDVDISVNVIGLLFREGEGGLVQVCFHLFIGGIAPENSANSLAIAWCFDDSVNFLPHFGAAVDVQGSIIDMLSTNTMPYNQWYDNPPVWHSDDLVRWVINQLNGHNGEVTGSDDVDTTAADNQKNRKIAAARRRFGNPGEKSGPVQIGAPPEVAEAAKVIIAKDEEKVDKPPPPPAVVLRVCKMEDLTLTWNGKEFGIPGNADAGEMIYCLPPDQHEFGWLQEVPLTNPKGMYRSMTEPWLFERCPLYMLDGVRHEAIVGNVFRGLRSAIRAKYPKAKPDMKYLEVVQMHTLKYFPDFIPMLAFTMSFIVHEVHYLGTQMSLDAGLQRKVDPTIVVKGEFDNEYARNMIRLGVEWNEEHIRREPSAICTLPLDWEVRTDYKLVNLDNNVCQVDEEGHLIFISPDDITDQHRTIMCGLPGLGQPYFVEYANTASNVTHALKRMIGTEDDAFERRKIGVGLAYLVAEGLAAIRRPHMLEHVKTMCDKRYPKWWGLNGRAASKHESGGTYFFAKPEDLDHKLAFECVKQSEYVAYMTTQMAQLLEKCDRSIIQTYVDEKRAGLDWLYYGCYEKYTELVAPFVGRIEAAEILHIKRAMRRMYVKGVALHEDKDVMVKKLSACIKRELAKYGKAPRLFVAYGGGSMYANELPEFVKIAYCGEYTTVVNGVTGIFYIYAKPREEKLVELLQQIRSTLTSTNVMYYLIFSDDAIMVGNIRGHTMAVNIDTASNDSNQDAFAFGVTGAAVSQFNHERAKGLIQQCMLPILITDPKTKLRCGELKFDGPFEGSGTTITTILNHTSDYAICSSIHWQLAWNFVDKQSDVDRCIKVGAACIGHKCTAEMAGTLNDVIFERVQFLKRSPMETVDGDWVFCLNDGAILRSFGSIEGDMDARMLNLTVGEFRSLSWPERMERFLQGVVKGLKNEHAGPVLVALRQRFMTESNFEVITRYSEEVTESEYSKPNIKRESWLRRYDMSEIQLQELEFVIHNLKLGMEVATFGAACIYTADYGVSVL